MNIFKQIRKISHINNVFSNNNHIFLNHTILRFNSYKLDLKIGNTSLNNYIFQLEKEYYTLKEDPNLKSDKRINQLQPLINILQERNLAIENIENLKELLEEKDSEIKQLAEDEKHSFEEHIQELDGQLKDAILPVDTDDNFNAIVLEVSAGVGGQEAMLFAKQLFDLYSNFIEYKGWESQLAEYLATDIGGIRHASVLISGHDAYRYFKYEAGVHRVQRIPATEKSGRIHTSTVSVIALPQPTDIQIYIQSKDLKVETKRATGAGGQHVNTTDSAVRIVHLPTGMAVECQTNRSQIKNREIAMQRLRAKLYEQQLDAQIAESAAARKSQVRSNFRNEKIRTYNFSQDRITDHRLQGSNIHNLKGFMQQGEPLEDLIEKIDYTIRMEHLIELINKKV